MSSRWLALLTLLLACRAEEVVKPGPLPPEGTVPVELRTDKVQYTMGAAAKTTMVNRSTDIFTMGVCNDVLERDASAGWVEIPPGHVACIALAIIVNPGDSVTLALDLKPASMAGTYRVRRQFSVVHGSTAETVYRRSNTFAVTR